VSIYLIKYKTVTHMQSLLTV